MVGADAYDDEVVGFGDDVESREAVIKEFVPVSINARERGEEVKEGGVVSNEDETVVAGSWGYRSRGCRG